MCDGGGGASLGTASLAMSPELGLRSKQQPRFCSAADAHDDVMCYVAQETRLITHSRTCDTCCGSCLTRILCPNLLRCALQSGAAIYAMRIPERWYPGKFDLVLHSHQLFHVSSRV